MIREAVREQYLRVEHYQRRVAPHKAILRRSLLIAAIAVSVPAMGFVVWQARGARIGLDMGAILFLAVSIVLWQATGLLGAARWHCLIGAITRKARPPFAMVVRAVFFARCLGLFAPAILADMVGRFAFAAGQVEERRRLAASVAADKSLDALLAALLVPSGVLLLAGGSTALVCSAYAAACVLPVVAAPVFVRLLPGRRVGSGTLRGVWLLTIARSMLLALATAAAAAPIQLGVHPMAFLVLIPIAQFVALVAFTPGGWGILEAGWVGLLVAAGATAETAATFAILQRAVQVVAFAAGAATVRLLVNTHAGERRRIRRPSHARASTEIRY